MKLAWDSEHRVDKHDGQYHRERSDDLYHTARWTRLSRVWRSQAEHALCAECLRKGIIKGGQVVDHIIPWPVCQDFFDASNFQTLCEECNNAKGQRDKEIIAKWRRETGGHR